MKTLATVFLLFALPSFAYAAVCRLMWDGDQLAATFIARPDLTSIRLEDKNHRSVVEVSRGQVMVFQEAKERISRVVDLSPSFIICSDSDPNAFAIPTSIGSAVGVTVGMLKIVNGDPDEAAYVIGHELAHHVRNHIPATQTREAVIGLLEVLAGAVLKKYTPKHYGSGFGPDIARLGGTMVSAKFSRDQEREADDFGVRYMVSAGYDPYGAVRLADLFVSKGEGGIGLFYDNHPGWEERADRLRTMIAEDPALRQRFAQQNSGRNALSGAQKQPQESVAFTASAQLSPAQDLFVEAVRAYKNEDLSGTVNALRKSSDLGYAPAQASLGSMYLNGWGGLQEDDVEAVRLYRLAAVQRNALGQSSLGMMYLNGRGGLRKDDVEAVRLFRLAAEQGNASGQNNLGTMYAQGRGGLAKDDVEAVRLFRLVAEQGNPLGQANLGSMYAQGRGGLANDDAEAVRLYRLAAEQGNGQGLANLGQMYERGRGGLPKDDVEAVRLYRLAAEQGNSLGQANLGAMYELGRGGLPRDVNEAIIWYKKAAAQDYELAEKNLARLGVN